MLTSSVNGEARRTRVLRALGITPWTRRTAPVAVEAADVVVEPMAGAACLVLLPQGCGTRELDLLGRALNAAGALVARAGRVSPKDGQLPADLPEAQAYLVFGEAQAHALGRHLSAAAMHRAQIVLVDEPAQVLTQPAAKRRLWNGLRNVRRALASMGH